MGLSDGEVLDLLHSDAIFAWANRLMLKMCIRDSAKGLSPFRVVCVHVLRNTMIPLVTVLGLELGSTIAFAVITESIFAWPGAGKLILDSLNALDRPVIVAYLIVVVCLFVTLNLIVDILYKVLDPRVRLEASA